MSIKTDPYEILGVSQNATEQEIKSAYRKLSKIYHPEQGKFNQVNLSEEERTKKFIDIHMAYEEAIKRAKNTKITINEEFYDNQSKDFEDYKVYKNNIPQGLRKEMSLKLKNYIKSDNIDLDEVKYIWFYNELEKIQRKIGIYRLNITSAHYYDYVIESFKAGKDQLIRFYLKVEKNYCKQNRIPIEVLEENPLDYDCSIEEFVQQLENLRKNCIEEKNHCEQNETSIEVSEKNPLDYDSFVEDFIKDPFNYDYSVGDFVQQLENLRKK